MEPISKITNEQKDKALVLRTSKSAGAGGDVQNFCECQAPVAPVLTQALQYLKVINL